MASTREKLAAPASATITADDDVHPRQAAEYIAEIAGQLSAIAKKLNLRETCYALDVAASQARADAQELGDPSRKASA